MGLLNEQTEKVIEVVKGTYTATGNITTVCDELHAFEGTGGQEVGSMMTIMMDKLNSIYERGINPKVSNVNVSVNGNTVSWECTIVESADGKAWVGFTSRGAGCNDRIQERAVAEYIYNPITQERKKVGNDVKSLIGRIKEKYDEPSIEIKVAKDYTYDGGGNSFRQIFYIYTKPKNFPPHKNKQSVVPTVGTTGTQPTGDTIQTNNTSPVNQTNNSSSAQQTTTTVPTTQKEFKYPDIEKAPFKPTNGDPWQYAYDGSKLLVKSPTTGNVFNLLDSNYFKAYPNSKLDTPEKLEKAKNEIKRLYGKELGL